MDRVTVDDLALAATLLDVQADRQDEDRDSESARRVARWLRREIERRCR